MKFLVVLTGLVAATVASPINAGYGIAAAPPVAIAPIAPIQEVNLPVGAPIIEPALRFGRPAVPFAPVPFQRALPLPALRRAPLPIQRALPLPALRHAPVAVPAPFALPRRAFSPVAVPAPLPFQAARAFPAPLPAAFAPAPLPLAAGPARHAPLPLAAAPAPLPFAAAPAPLPLAAAPVPAPLPLAAAAPSSQFHAQDELGGFSFGYKNLNSARNEVRSPDGVTRGAYEYVDANGAVQRVEYIADPVHGFRVAGSNIPVAGLNPVVLDTPEVAAAKADFALAYQAALARNAVAPVAVVDEIIAAPGVPITEHVVAESPVHARIAL